MSLVFNGMKMTAGCFNGKKVLGIYYNGNKVWPTEGPGPGPTPTDPVLELGKYTGVLLKFTPEKNMNIKTITGYGNMLQNPKSWELSNCVVAIINTDGNVISSSNTFTGKQHAGSLYNINTCYEFIGTFDTAVSVTVGQTYYILMPFQMYNGEPKFYYDSKKTSECYTTNDVWRIQNSIGSKKFNFNDYTHETKSYYITITEA